MKLMEYIIRETKSWKIKWYECWSLKIAIISAISVFAFILIVFSLLKPLFDIDYSSELYHFCMKVFFYIWFFYVISIIGRIYFKYKRYQDLQGARDFKIDWRWYVKKLVVSSIWKYVVDDNSEDWYKFYGYYFVLKDWNINYYSNAFEWWKLWWVDKETLSKIYKQFWYDYDDKETNKKNVLKEYDKNIDELNFKRENWWLFEKIVNSWKLYLAKTLDRDIIEKWYVPPYIQIWSAKVTVWDSLDVYKDYDNHENYWVDIDFLVYGWNDINLYKKDHSKQKINDIKNEIYSNLRNYLR